ncbi:MAG: DEAD/DEAH box helicase [Desulfobulbaceae bacterium]
MSFTQFDFNPKINAGIAACKYEIPTPIQVQAIPAILAGRDIMGLAQTGTGKTAAFVLPILQHLLAGPRGTVRTLIVAPTRELAEQIHGDISRMARETGLRSMAIYGGVSKLPQIKKIRAGVEIIVACPGRLLDHLREGAVNLAKVEHLVLDEADHMFDMGFLPDLRRILKFLPAKRQTLLFSATMPGEIRHLAEEILNNPERVQIAHSRPTATVAQVLYAVEQEQKTSLLKEIMAKTDMGATLIFTRTKHRAVNLARHLQSAGYAATSLQGNLSQNKRQQALNGFKCGDIKVLVATDIAARGIDVSGISHVINFDVPDTVEAYTHRVGRTGRAACTGEAFTFAGRDDRSIINQIERTMGEKMVRVNTSGLTIALDEESAVLAERPSRKPWQRDAKSARPARRGNSRPAGRTATGNGERREQRPAANRPAGARPQTHGRPAIVNTGSANLFLNS